MQISASMSAGHVYLVMSQLVLLQHLILHLLTLSRQRDCLFRVVFGSFLVDVPIQTCRFSVKRCCCGPVDSSRGVVAALSTQSRDKNKTRTCMLRLRRQTRERLKAPSHADAISAISAYPCDGAFRRLRLTQPHGSWRV